MPLLKSLLAWASILVLAVANGALREAVLIPSFGKAAGLVLSGVVLCGFIVAVACMLVRHAISITVTQSLLVGLLWLVLTLAFEFGFGLYIQHKSWEELASAYRFQDGNLWPIVLLFTLVAPYLATLLHAKSRHAKSGA